MSVSVFVSAVRDLDDQFARMLNVRDTCKRNGVSYPPEVVKYFGNCDSGVNGDADDLRRDMQEDGLVYGSEMLSSIKGLTEGDVMYGDGMTIDLTKLPKEFTKLRVYMS